MGNLFGSLRYCVLAGGYPAQLVGGFIARLVGSIVHSEGSIGFIANLLAYKAKFN